MNIQCIDCFVGEYEEMLRLRRQQRQENMKQQLLRQKQGHSTSNSFLSTTNTNNSMHSELTTNDHSLNQSYTHTLNHSVDESLGDESIIVTERKGSVAQRIGFKPTHHHDL